MVAVSVNSITGYSQVEIKNRKVAWAGRKIKISGNSNRGEGEEKKAEVEYNQHPVLLPLMQ